MFMHTVTHKKPDFHKQTLREISFLNQTQSKLIQELFHFIVQNKTEHNITPSEINTNNKTQREIQNHDIDKI